MRIRYCSSDVCSSDLDADQGDPDLHRRQKAPRIGSELPRDLRAPAATLFGRLQARVARRDDRQFGHGENAVEEDEDGDDHNVGPGKGRSEEHTSELQSLMRISYAVFCLQKKNKNKKR